MVGTPPTASRGGRLLPLDHPAAHAEGPGSDRGTGADSQAAPKVYENHREVDFAFGGARLARFRANFYQQRGTMSMAIRQVPLGSLIEELTPRHRRRAVAPPPRARAVTGTVGSGKSTTLASMWM